MKNGKKKVEGRLYRGIFSKLKIGDVIQWFNKYESFKLKIKNLVKYNTFEEMLNSQGLNIVLPNIENISDGVSIYI